jgi:hypothetical protein
MRVPPDVAEELRRQSEIMEAATWRPSSKWSRADAVLDVLERGTRSVERGVWPDDDWSRESCSEPVSVVVSARWLESMLAIAKEKRVSKASLYRRILRAGLQPNRRALVRREERAAV